MICNGLNLVDFEEYYFKKIVYTHLFYLYIFQEKLETTQRESYIQITTLQDENTQVRTVKDEMTKYIRELEQTNDDLERAKRYFTFIVC